jgi:hypothetical protein
MEVNSLEYMCACLGCSLAGFAMGLSFVYLFIEDKTQEKRDR